MVFSVLEALDGRVLPHTFVDVAKGDGVVFVPVAELIVVSLSAEVGILIEVDRTSIQRSVVFVIAWDV